MESEMDVFVTQPFSSYKLFFATNSSMSATYPIQASLLGLAPANER